jgi:DNA-binding transcriptional regulator YiaG
MDGAQIRSLRKQLGLTQEEFAHEIGVTFATVNRWENGKSKPSRLATKILTVLDEKTSALKKRKTTRRAKKTARRRR